MARVLRNRFVALLALTASTWCGALVQVVNAAPIALDFADLRNDDALTPRRWAVLRGGWLPVDVLRRHFGLWPWPLPILDLRH